MQFIFVGQISKAEKASNYHLCIRRFLLFIHLPPEIANRCAACNSVGQDQCTAPKPFVLMN